MLLKLNRLRSFTKSMKSLKSMQINASLFYCSAEPRIIKPKNTLEEFKGNEKKFWMENQDMFRITSVSEMRKEVLELRNQLETICENKRRVQEEIFNGRKKVRGMRAILDKRSKGDDTRKSVVPVVQQDQNQLQITPDIRILQELSNGQQKLIAMLAILDKRSKRDDTRKSVVKQVRGLLKEQRRLQSDFTWYVEREEGQLSTFIYEKASKLDLKRNTFLDKCRFLPLVGGVVIFMLSLV